MHSIPPNVKLDKPKNPKVQRLISPLLHYAVEVPVTDLPAGSATIYVAMPLESSRARGCDLKQTLLEIVQRLELNEPKTN